MFILNLVSRAPGGGQRGGCSWGGAARRVPLQEASPGGAGLWRRIAGGPLWEATSQAAMGALFVRSHGSYGSVPI